MNWDSVVNKVRPYIVAIDTPTGRGTGFLCLNSEAWWGIATAAHVIADAEQWQQPIRIRQDSTNKQAFLKEDSRVIFPQWNTDSAVILLQKSNLEFPETPITLLPRDRSLNVGVEVGWLGYPAVAPYELCFFAGIISARRENRNAYLIDGVAINGVSGGPVVYLDPANGTQIVGIITAYISNQATGATLPGLSVAQDVLHFHEVTQGIRSFDEAKSKHQDLQDGSPPIGSSSQDQKELGVSHPSC
jgi:hypothetical protein